MSPHTPWIRTAQLAMQVSLLLLVACGQAAAPTADRSTVTPTPFQPQGTLTLLPPVDLPTSSALPALTSPAEAQPAADTPAANVPRLTFFHRSGQTFLTWEEARDISGETYRVYRANFPITGANLAQAEFLVQVGKNSARFYANRYHDQGVWGPRLSDTFIFNKGALRLRPGTGALVWTLGPEDFGGQSSGVGYYAVTITPPGGVETFSANYTAGPAEESVQDPLPVEISYTPGIKPGPGGHFYMQYMDLRHWNPTFHAPNDTNQYLGLDPKDPALKDALAYAYDYSIFEPTEEMCGGKVPDTLPVVVYLHGWRDNRYPTPLLYDNASCAYGVYPVDESQTWYFGFAQKHNYRKGGVVGEGDQIENYTEQRVLRMVYDLMRDPPGPAVDSQRVYLLGQSMGGTGALAFAERYPNIFAAIYSGQPLTDFRHSTATQDWPADVSIKWGAPALNLPIVIRGPGNWADPLQKYSGKVGVWDWQNYQASLMPDGQPGGIPGRSADEMVPFGIDHGSRDDVIPFDTQAQPLYPLLNASRRTWGGAVIDAEHTWTKGKYLPPTLARREKDLFWDYRVIRDETVPGISLLSSNDPNVPTGPTTYNQTIHWSASWAAWDGPPVDEPGRWKMSFCSVAAGSQECGSGSPQTVDITPRRLQKFIVKPGAEYMWQNQLVSDGQVVANGTVVADGSGLITVQGFQVTASGNRLVIIPRQ